MDDRDMTEELVKALKYCQAYFHYGGASFHPLQNHPAAVVDNVLAEYEARKETRHAPHRPE